MKKDKVSVDSLKHLEIAEQLYIHGGQSAVYSYANKSGITDWRFCNQCVGSAPCVSDTCLVCGNNLEGVLHSESFDVDENHVPKTIKFTGVLYGKKITFSAYLRTQSDYPGIDIKVNNSLVAIVEYTSDEKEIRTIAYTADDEEPKTITTFKKVK